MAIPKGLRALREAVHIIEESTRCERCGKLRFHRANKFNGHGTGQHGESVFDATSFEDDDRHCHCHDCEYPETGLHNANL